MKHLLLFGLTSAALAAGSSAWAQTVLKLAPGTSYTFTSETAATGTGTVSYQWYRNGAAISGATGATYTLPGSLAKGINVEFKRGAKTPSCSDFNFSNSYIVTFCLSSLSIGNICWADANVDDYQAFAARPDMYTKFYQWNKSTPWVASGNVGSGWSSTANTSATWTVNPCPEGWRLPTQGEFQELHDGGSTWANANSARGNAVSGRFYGPNHSNSSTCKLPSSMTNCIFLPANGYRGNGNGLLEAQSSTGSYWSGTQNSANNGYYLAFGGSSLGVYDSNKADAISLRCVQ